MIKEFKNEITRETGIVNKGMFEQVKMLYERGQVEDAGELAISILELVLTGGYSSDNLFVEFAMKDHSIVVEKSRNNYDRKLEANRTKQIENLKLDLIAELLAAGHTQAAIAQILEESTTTINYRVRVLREKYPELLEEAHTKNTKNPKNPNYKDKDKDKDKDEDEDEDKDVRFSNAGRLAAGPQPSSPLTINF
jgi:transposase-like protein